MAATLTVPQHSQQRNFIPIRPQRGVITLFGYGIKAQVDRGHLVIEDGIGPERRQARFPRVGHGLRRLVVIGADGMVTLAALRWLADQDASFTLLDRDGSVLAITGPIGPSDARLRRSQSLAQQSGTAVEIARGLITQKLEGQERLVRDVLRDSAIAQTIATFRSLLRSANSILAIRQLESQAAQAYWSAWHDLPISFPTADLRRVPEHWRTFGTRKSPLTGSPRLAVNPANAILNYLYALLESEARLAAASLGLDPGIGFLHVDTDARDSLACDLMEPVRPHIDAFLLDWIREQPVRREWFFEQRDGSCRLMASFVVRLSESLPAWRQILAPIAEWVSRVLWSNIRRPGRPMLPATHLTQSHRRNAKGKPHPQVVSPFRPPHLCQTCGTNITAGSRYCPSCAVAISTPELIKGARKARDASHSPEAQASRVEKGRRNTTARWAWEPSNLPAWLNEQSYSEEILPRLARITVRAIASALGVSIPYASSVRNGKRQPHQRHWLTLARLVGIAGDQPPLRHVSK